MRYGADPTATDDHGNTPLHCACGACDEAVARLLRRAGVNPNAVKLDGQTPGQSVPQAPWGSAYLIDDVLNGR